MSNVGCKLRLPASGPPLSARSACAALVAFAKTAALVRVGKSIPVGSFPAISRTNVFLFYVPEALVPEVQRCLDNGRRPTGTALCLCGPLCQSVETNQHILQLISSSPLHASRRRPTGKLCRLGVDAAGDRVRPATGSHFQLARRAPRVDRAGPSRSPARPETARDGPARLDAAAGPALAGLDAGQKLAIS